MYVNSLQCHNDLKQIGFFKTKIDIPSHWQELVATEKWPQLDREIFDFTSCQVDAETSLVKLLKEHCDFNSIEFIISIRDADNPWEEDGIWHDDGSRKLAFSLSLTNAPENLLGGVLEIRKKGNQKSHKIAPFAFGEIVVFATGGSGFEHKINQVTKGKRIIIAGWCS